MQYFTDEKSRDKIYLVQMARLEKVEEDWINCNSFIEKIEKLRDSTKVKYPEFKDNPIFIFPNYCREDGDLFIEMWVSRTETDEEFKKRIESIDNEEENKQKDQWERIQRMAAVYGWNVTKE